MKRDDFVVMELPVIEIQVLALYEHFDDDVAYVKERYLYDIEDRMFDREMVERSSRRVNRAQRRDEWR